MPGTVMPSPHPVACSTSCCTRTCAQPQGRPCLGVEPLLHLTPWAQAHWAALHPEVEQVCCCRWEPPNPVGVGCVSVAGFQVCLDDGHLMFLGVRSFSQATGLCMLRAWYPVQTRSPRASSWCSQVPPQSLQPWLPAGSGCPPALPCRCASPLPICCGHCCYHRPPRRQPFWTILDHPSESLGLPGGPVMLPLLS